MAYNAHYKKYNHAKNNDPDTYFCRDRITFEHIFGTSKLYGTYLRNLAYGDFLNHFNEGLLGLGETILIPRGDDLYFISLIGSLYNPYIESSLYLKKYAYINNIWLKLYSISVSLYLQRTNIAELFLSNFTLGIEYGDIPIYYFYSESPSWLPSNHGYNYDAKKIIQHRYHPHYTPSNCLMSDMLIILGYTINTKKHRIFQHPTEIYLQWKHQYTPSFVNFYAQCIHTLIKNDTYTYPENMKQIVFDRPNTVKFTYEILSTDLLSDNPYHYPLIDPTFQRIFQYTIIFFETMRLNIITLKGATIPNSYGYTSCINNHEIVNSIKHPSLLLLKSHPLHNRLKNIFYQTLNLLNTKFREYI
jgi:hypothetical protein